MGGRGGVLGHPVTGGGGGGGGGGGVLDPVTGGGECWASCQGDGASIVGDGARASS